MKLHIYLRCGGLVLALLFLMVQERCHARTNAELIDSLEIRLEELNNPDDSIRTLLNIYDLGTTRKVRYKALERVRHTAKLRGLNDVLIEVLTYTANEMRDNDSVLAIVDAELRAIPESPRQMEAKLFLDMVKIDRRIKSDTNETAADHLRKLMDKYETDSPHDAYEEALLLYSLCKHMQLSTRGELLEEYIDKLSDLVGDMNLPSGSVRNLIYNRASSIYAVNGSARNAIAVDRKMLNIVDSLATSYRAQGRPFRDMMVYRYSIFRRMLINYRELSPEEVEMFYKKAHEIAQTNERAAGDLRLNNSIEICYLLAHKKYREAIRLFKEQKDGDFHRMYRIYFLNEIVGAARAVDDRRTLLEASMELNDSLRSRIERRADERCREMQIVYDLSELRKMNSQLMLDDQRSHLRLTRTVLVVVAVALVILVVLALVFFRSYRRSRRLAKMHSETAERLREERNELRRVQKELIEMRDKAKHSDKLKTEFINNMSHEVKAPLEAIMEYSQLIMDCIPPEKQRYLDRYACTMKQNTKLIMTLLNDVLDMASLEHGSVAVHKKPESIWDMCNLALDNIFDSDNAGDVKVVFNPQRKADALVSTDKVRVCQVLMNLLSNARKFTEKGSITLDYDIDRKGNKVTFAVSDTGTGVADGCGERIFERYYKIDPSSQGCGLGLYIARMLATLMQGEVRHDTNYHNGARFIFTIPL